MGGRDDPAVRGLPEDFGEPHHRHHAAVDEVAQDHARPHRRQLVHIAHQQQTGIGWQGAEVIRFQKPDDISVRSAAAWDDQNLYLAWDVRDKTPWINGAEQPENIYLSGDTVDFQLATDAQANPKRDKAALGDLRLSIGNFKGAATAVLYRPVAKTKHPMTFSSGVVKEYKLDSVEVLKDVQLKITRRGDSYVVEAAVPLTSLGLKLSAALSLRGDFGVTYGDAAGQRTRLRNYWNNQHTGIVDDAVFELTLEPKNWGELLFK